MPTSCRRIAAARLPRGVGASRDGRRRLRPLDEQRDLRPEHLVGPRFDRETPDLVLEGPLLLTYSGCDGR